MVDKIVVADDEPDVLNLMRRVLEKAGFLVVTASDGLEAEEKVLSELPDAVILDVVMPKKGGFEVCSSIKEQERTSFIPVLLVTALNREIDRKMGEEAGADGYLSKPFKSEELVTEVRKHIEASRLSRFSKALGRDQDAGSGRMILLEFSSLFPYERAVRDYVLEAKANGYFPVVITTEYNAVHSALKDEEGVEFIPCSLPLVLSPIFNRHKGVKIRFVLDSISDLILTSGIQPAYHYVRDILPRLSRENFFAIFLLNPDAHPSADVQSIRTLFRDHLSFNEEGLRKIRFS